MLLARHDRAALAYIPGTVTGDEGAGYAGTDMLPLGRWEGESFSTYCSTFTGLSVHDVCIYGRGAIDGQTDFAEDNWWNKDFKNIFRPEEGREIARPRMIFLSECENVSLAGFTVRNSPAWNIHPILCEHVDAPVPVHRGSQELPQHRRFRSRELRFCPHPWLSVLGGRRLHRHQERQNWALNSSSVPPRTTC